MNFFYKFSEKIPTWDCPQMPGNSLFPPGLATKQEETVGISACGQFVRTPGCCRRRCWVRGGSRGACWEAEAQSRALC